MLSAALDALVRADAEALARLEEEARRASMPREATERRAAVAAYSALEKLLRLTRQNLRLLRGNYADGYGIARS